MKTGEAAGDVARKLPARVESVRGRFDKWRRERPSKACPIPTELWAAAARCARQFGYHRTAQALGLDSGKLKLKRKAGSPVKAVATRVGPMRERISAWGTWTTDAKGKRNSRLARGCSGSSHQMMVGRMYVAP